MTAEKMMELADELDSYNNESRVLPRATRVMQKAAIALRSLAVGAGAREALEAFLQAYHSQASSTKALREAAALAHAALQSEPVQGCILCANGNDLPEGEQCAGCGREGHAVGLRAAVIKARGRSEPPASPVHFSEPVQPAGTGEQQPVAWLVTWPDGGVNFCRGEPPKITNNTYQPLYASPPVRPEAPAGVCDAGCGKPPCPRHTREGMLAWATSRWQSEVANRPLQNVHRRSLDTTWRQVIRKLGGDPDALVGPSHDDLVDLPSDPVRRTTQQGGDK